MLLDLAKKNNYCFFFQAEDGIRDAQESRGLGDVYMRQRPNLLNFWLSRRPNLLNFWLSRRPNLLNFWLSRRPNPVYHKHLTLPTPLTV